MIKLKTYIKIIPIVFLLVFSSCKTLFQRGEKEQRTVSEMEKHESSALLIEGTRERIKGNINKAIVNYATAVEKDPGNSAAYFELAKIHAIEGQYDDALIFARRANRIDPDNLYYRIILADIYSLNREFEKTLEIERKLAEDYPRDVNLYLNLVETLTKLSRYKEAIEVYNQLESVIGYSDEIAIERQSLYLEIGETKKAIEEVEKLVKLFPGNYRYLDYLSDLYLTEEMHDKAFELYEKMLKIDPDSPYSLLLIADYYRAQENNEKAFEYLERAFASPYMSVEDKEKVMLSLYRFSANDEEYLKLAYDFCEKLLDEHPDRAEVHYIYGDFLYRDKEYKKAREAYLKAVEIQPDNPGIWDQILHIDGELNDHESMLKHSTMALEYFFEHPLLFYYQGISAYNQKEYKITVDAMKQGVLLVLSDDTIASDFYALMADAYSKLEMHEESDKAYEHALDKNPENPYALNNYSYSLCERKKDLEKAKQMSKLSNELNPGLSSFQDTYAWILYQLGNYDEAMVWIEKAIENMEENRPLVLEHYGDILYKTGKKEEAIKNWEKALEAGEGSSLLEKKINDKTLYE